MSTCLSDRNLASYVAGSATSEPMSAWNDHLDRCDSCAVRGTTARREAPDRRIRHIPCAVAIAAALAVCASVRAAEARPNILVILADDVGWADVGYHGSAIRTPHIDRLAREGIELDQHYVTPVCSPTRTALLSGRYSSRFGVTAPTNEQVFPLGTETLASALRSVGYDTALTGKWHLGSKPVCGPNEFGFDHSHGALAGGVDQYGHFYKDGPYRRTWHRNGAYIEQTGHTTDLFLHEALRVIEAERDGPFFLYVAFTAAHIPLQEPRRWLRLYDGKINKPSRKLYAAAVSHMDDAIGQMVAALERTGQRRNTLIVFMSDNGGARQWLRTEQYGGGHLPVPVQADNRPLRGWKGSVYEGGIRVPALVNWPGVLKPAVVRTPVHVVDWMPTLTRLAGYRPRDDLQWDGTDILNQLRDPQDPVEPRTLYWPGPGHRSAAVRHGDWKLVVSRANGAHAVELFNLRDDPGESKNLASKEPARVADLQRRLAKAAARDNTAVVKNGS